MKITYFPIVALAFLTILSSAALAEERSVRGLPGVEQPQPIVSAPPPAPEPDQAPAGTGRNFRIGNTDVSISGDIIIDVGAGNRGNRRH